MSCNTSCPHDEIPVADDSFTSVETIRRYTSLVYPRTFYRGVRYTDLDGMRAMADAGHVASLRVTEKLGMVREGVLRQNRLVRGEFINEVWCGVLRTEWAAQRH
jgi:hypothetical protein